MVNLNRQFEFVESGREENDSLVNANGKRSESLPTIRGTAGVGGKLIEPPVFRDVLREDLTKEDVLEIF